MLIRLSERCQISHCFLRRRVKRERNESLKRHPWRKLMNLGMSSAPTEGSRVEYFSSSFVIASK